MHDDLGIIAEPEVAANLVIHQLLVATYAWKVYNPE